MSKPPRNHIVSQFYYRNFTSTPDKHKNQQRVYTLDHNGVIENIEKSGRKIGSICHEMKCQRLFRPQFRKVRFQFFLLKFERCQIP